MGKEVINTPDLKIEVREEIADSLSITGKVERCSVPDILNLLNMQKKTGVLVVKYNDVEKRIYLKDGEIVFASSTLTEDRLGESLVRRGKITKEQLEEASKEMFKGKKLGKILVEKGWITPKELFYGVRDQVQEIVFSLFSLSEGVFYFLEGVVDQENIVRFNMSTQKLIMEGIRIADELGMFKKMYHSNMFVFCQNNPDGKVEGSVEAILINAIKDGVKIGNLRKITGLSDYEIFKGIYNLHQKKIIEVRESGKLEIEEIIGDVNSILKGIYSIIKERAPDFDYLSFFNNFFEGFTEELNELFDEEGGIDVERLINNYKKSNVPEKDRLIMEVLRELIRFELFELKAYLKEEENEELQKVLAETGLM